MSVSAYIALGSNLGDRKNLLDQALQALQEEAGITVVRVSSYHETAPVGGPPGQGHYLNAAAELRTDLSPEELLQVLLRTERALGRVRGERFGPRIIDLDLLLYDDLIRNKSELTVPHPRMHERRFVLEPLCEIAPQAAHPLFRATIADLLLKLGSTGFQLVETGGMPALPAQRDLVGLRAVVTGSTSGIGRAIALELAGAGADIVVHGRRSEAADSLTAQIRSMNVRADSILADLSQPSGCRTLGQRAWEIWNGIDIWVNNAGADTLTGEAAHWPFEKKLKALWEVDVQTTILLSRDIGQRMKTRGSGVILNIGWDQAETGMEGDSGQMFSAVKAAIMAFTRSLALSLAPEVRVNCLAPGWIKTAWGDAASDRWQERVRRETPLKRWGTSEDVARAAHWLASPAASFITGQIIRVNGGAVR